MCFFFCLQFHNKVQAIYKVKYQKVFVCKDVCHRVKFMADVRSMLDENEGKKRFVYHIY